VRPLSGKSAFLNRERARDTPTTMAKLQGGSVLSALLGQRTDTSSNGGEPDSGRRLVLSSAIEAGTPKGQITTSATRSTFVLQHHGGSRLVELDVGGPRPLVYVCLYCLGTRAGLRRRRTWTRFSGLEILECAAGRVFSASAW
jgi:hypothetical protein